MINMRKKILYYTILTLAFVFLFACSIVVVMLLNIRAGSMWHYFILIVCLGIFGVSKGSIKSYVFKKKRG